MSDNKIYVFFRCLVGTMLIATPIAYTFLNLTRQFRAALLRGYHMIP